MSPLNDVDKGPKNKDLAIVDPAVDNKTDRKKQKTLQNYTNIDTSELPPDLLEIVTIWPELPAHIKAAIKALIQTHTKEND